MATNEIRFGEYSIYRIEKIDRAVHRKAEEEGKRRKEE
jgi:hypothetical protein